MPDTDSAAVTEAFSTSRDAAGTGLALAQIDQSAPRGRPVLWVQDARAAQEAGLPSARGLASLGRPVLRVAVGRALDALWAMEEGLECNALSAVIGEIWGDPKALDFTATKRLALRARRSGVGLWLLRPDGGAQLSVAPERWRVSAAPSGGNVLDPRAPGRARWRAELFRSRKGKPGEWVASHDRAAHRLDLVAALPDGALGEGAGVPAAPRSRAVGGGG
ncbi:ImuA family protein [Jannaschia ovalis]|uniref:Protein ImuA n=1 Tax=Jannaschia ovalis TaxID=3038773 RepID=A0ABY8LBD3_9RHOB|nr:hypothetical protein [Jannaschia sp. GRR-S6-38]WGH77488.1 hypothetical protein P8627_10590 [Jannaschia sp. GRR-S6-38]